MSLNLELRLPSLEKAVDRFPVQVTPDTPLVEVLALMSLGGEGTSNSVLPATPTRSSCVLIVEAEQLVGIFTERDVVRLTVERMDFAGVAIAEVMTRQVFTLTLTDNQDISTALQVMRQHQIRHLPVVDAQKHLSGIVTFASIHRVLQPSNLLRTIRVEEVMATQVTHASAKISVLEIAQLMKRELSCVVITKGLQVEKLNVEGFQDNLQLANLQPSTQSQPVTPIGIITERDIVQFQTCGLDFSTTQAQVVMSTPLVCLRPDDSLWAAQQQMQRLRVRRLVVTGSCGELCGIVTQTSILKAFDPTEVYGVVEVLQQEIEQQTIQIKRSNQQLEQEVEKRQQAEAELRALFKAMTDLILVVDAQGRYLKIVSTNPALLYRPPADLVGKTLHQVFERSQADTFLSQLRQALATQQTVSVEYSLNIQDREVWFAASISPLSGNAVIWVARDITPTKQAEAALRQKEERYRSLYENTPVMLHSIDSAGKLISVSNYWLEKLGYNKSEVLGRRSTEFLSTDSQHYASTVVLPEFFKTGLCKEIPYQFVKKNGEIMDVLLSATAERDAAGQIVRTLAVIVDVTERKRMERELFQEKELAHVTLQSIGDAVITTDKAGRIKYFNSVAEQLTGWNVREAKGLPLSEVFNIVDEVTRERAENPVEKVLRSDQIVGLANHTILIARDRTEHAIDNSAAPIRNREGSTIGVVLVFHDVTQSRNLSRQLSWQASHDALTGLVNRRRFEQCLAEAIESAQGDRQQHILCYLDLDQFKIVNDTCGHVAGDELLRQVTTLLQSRIRSTDILARLGGDEFGLLLFQCPIAKGEQIADALRQLIEAFRFFWQDKIFTIGASIGLVAIDADTPGSTSVLSAADAACYAAKDKGRNCIHTYRDNDRELARQRGERQWIAKINEALAENRFCLYCQKFVAIAPERSEAHHEILLRMIDKEGNLVPPMAFIPAAERYNLMPAVDRWIISKFLSSYERHLQKQQERQHRSLYTINLSGTSINSERFLSFLKEQFARYQVPPQTICFEITETTAIANLSRAAQLIEEVKHLGCSFALDDFGNGMSSLAYLKNLPVDYLKIDGSFVKNLTNDPVDYAMVESFNHIARAMGIQTIAEFVEDEQTLEKLRSIGVDYAQGYGIAKPCPLQFD